MAFQEDLNRRLAEEKLKHEQWSHAPIQFKELTWRNHPIEPAGSSHRTFARDGSLSNFGRPVLARDSKGGARRQGLDRNGERYLQRSPEQGPGMGLNGF